MADNGDMTMHGRRELRSTLTEELAGVHPRWQLVRVLTTWLPVLSFNRVRSQLMRLAGFQLGEAVVFYGPILISGYGPTSNLRIGDGCHVNAHVDFDLSGVVEIEGHVGIGQEVLFMTNSHDIGDPHQRGGETRVKTVTVKEGAWLGARATILPGVTIGEGAVVAAGSVVTKDVAPHTLVAGTPAVLKRDLANG